MSTYSFSNLGSIDFEELACDLIGRELGLSFELFAPTHDQGIDGRYMDKYESIIIQVKHYKGRIPSNLKSNLKKEFEKIKKLNPSRYYLVTSCNLSPKYKNEIFNILNPYLKTEGDIYTRRDLNRLLRIYPDIEESHPKLWIGGSGALCRVLNADIHNYSNISNEEAQAKARLFVFFPGIEKAKNVLDKMNAVIISGPPGVGKTCMAQILMSMYINRGWHPYGVQDVDKVFKIINQKLKYFFLIDDFLGSNLLDVNYLSRKDNAILKLLHYASKKNNIKIILTTRAYILHDAQIKSEKLKSEEINIIKYILELNEFDRVARAKILYNHLSEFDVSQDKINELVSSKELIEIIDHENFFPRIIEWMTNELRIGGIPPNEYPAAFISMLNDPNELWKTIFEQSLSNHCRNLLMSLYFFPNNNVDRRSLEIAFESVHAHLCTVYNSIERKPENFNDALFTLENGFIKIYEDEDSRLESHNKSNKNEIRIKFINPSLSDWMSKYLNKPELLLHLSKTAKHHLWAENLWEHGKKFMRNDIKKFCLSFIEFGPQLSKTSHASYGKNPRHDFSMLPFVRRLELSLEWLQLTNSTIYATTVNDLINKPPKNWNIAFGNLSTAFIILGKMKSKRTYAMLPNSNKLFSRFQKMIGEILQDTRLEDIYSYNKTLKSNSKYITSDMMNLFRNSIYDSIQFFCDESLYEYEKEDLESFSEILTDSTLKSILIEHDLPEDHVDNANSYITERLDEIDKEEEEEAEYNDFDRHFPSNNSQDNSISDKGIYSLFSRLHK